MTICFRIRKLDDPTREAAHEILRRWAAGRVDGHATDRLFCDDWSDLQSRQRRPIVTPGSRRS